MALIAITDFGGCLRACGDGWSPHSAQTIRHHIDVTEDLFSAVEPVAGWKDLQIVHHSATQFVVRPISRK